jgi:hypothetical protein
MGARAESTDLLGRGGDSSGIVAIEVSGDGMCVRLEPVRALTCGGQSTIERAGPSV